MRGPLPPEGFAEQVGVPLERVESYLSLGLLDPEGDGLLDDYDVLRLALLSHFEDQGHAPERIPAELEQESHSVAQRIFRLGKDKYTLQDAADQVGVTLEQAQELSLALGFPIDSPLDREDIEPFGHLRGLLEIGMPWEIIIEGARVFSDALRRVAQAEINMTHRVLCERMAAEGAGEKDIMVAFHEAGPTLMELSSALLQHIHEDFLVQALADHAVGHLETTSATSVRGLQETTVLFVDLALFTPLAQAHGDELAAAVLDRFDAIVRKTNMSHGGRLVKQIGDAFMLTFSEPADAVRFSIETLDEARKEHEFPALRIGINSGPVLYRVGDYVGNTVNVASRVMSMAMPNVILMTESVATAARAAGITVEEVGVRRLRGAEEAMAMYRVATTQVSALDPVCGMIVPDPPAARLVHLDREYSFCSHDCAMRFLEDPDRYTTAAAS
jgi:adenylate cyclase